MRGTQLGGGPGYLLYAIPLGERGVYNSYYLVKTLSGPGDREPKIAGPFQSEHPGQPAKLSFSRAISNAYSHFWERAGGPEAFSWTRAPAGFNLAATEQLGGGDGYLIHAKPINDAETGFSRYYLVKTNLEDREPMLAGPFDVF
jgi:hypothetical protein